ncbi:MAG: hypothetical protein ACK5IP_18960 [Paracoccus sp. (in: a-proteobacteria)]
MGEIARDAQHVARKFPGGQDMAGPDRDLPAESSVSAANRIRAECSLQRGAAQLLAGLAIQRHRSPWPSVIRFSSATRLVLPSGIRPCPSFQP